MDGWVSTGMGARTDSPRSSARPRDRTAAPGTRAALRCQNPCSQVSRKGLFPLPRRGWRCPAAAALPQPRPGLSGHFAELPQRESSARRGQELRETTSFQQVNHPRGKRRDQSYAGTAHRARAGILEKLPLIQIVQRLGMWCL